MMTAMLSGWTFARLQDLDGVLQTPITWDECGTDGTIVFHLASGMRVTVSIDVEPIDNG